MDSELSGELTAIISEVHAGDQHAKGRLVCAIYDELHRIAASLMSREQPGHTLQPTALVNEALLRVLDSATLGRATNRRYIYAAAAQAMRQVLVDHARRRNTAKPA